MDIFNAMKKDFVPTPQEYKLLSQLRQKQMPILIGISHAVADNYDKKYYLYFRSINGYKMSIIINDGTHHELGLAEFYIVSGAPYMSEDEYKALPDFDANFVQVPIQLDLSTQN